VLSVDDSTILGTEILIRAVLSNDQSRVQERAGNFTPIP
jgi:hypothetical protein